jgi:N-acetylglutamate synthase-like GNAT family acetyltransferase
MDIKIPSQNEWSKVHQFLHKNLRAETDWNLRDEYPLAFADKNMGNLRIIEKDDQVVAHAVMKPSLIRTHYHLFKVGFIGSVVTDKQHRGQGYSRQIIESCLDASRQQECDFALLWTDLFDFYSKLGFEVGGQEIALQLGHQFQLQEKEGLRMMEGPQVSPEAILKLYNKHNLRTLRLNHEVRDYLKIPRSQVYTAWNQSNGQLEAYCIMGKGADFTNYIHEWGGNVSSLLALISYMKRSTGQTLTLITPPQCTNMIKQLEERGAEKFFGILGMFKITHPIHFCKKIKRGARQLGFDQFIFEHRDGVYFFGSGTDVYQTDCDADIVRLVFGPMKPDQIHQFKDETLEVMNEIFPIPFWVWGWDSI